MSSPSALPPEFTLGPDDRLDESLVESNPEAVAGLVACVLRRAHRMADLVMSPGDARAILQVAHSFADELATADPQFDRLRFIRDATRLEP